MELIVTPLPEQTTTSSLYTEAGEGVRVLSTRFRTRAVLEDTRGGASEGGPDQDVAAGFRSDHQGHRGGAAEPGSC